MKQTTILFLFVSSIAGCANRESGRELESLPEPRTVEGLLSHFPSNVRSVQAWSGHNFLVGDTPVIPTEEVPEETLKRFVGSRVIVTGVWHPGEAWNPTEEEKNLPMPQFPDSEVIVRGDGLKASSISRADQ